jgi:hypothetical protein
MKRVLFLTCTILAALGCLPAEAGVNSATVQAITDEAVATAIAGLPQPVPTPTAIRLFPTPTPLTLPPTPTALRLPPTPTAVTLPPTATRQPQVNAAPPPPPAATPTPRPQPTPMLTMPFTTRAVGKLNTATFAVKDRPFRFDMYTEGVIGPVRIRIGDPLTGKVDKVVYDGLTSLSPISTYIYGFSGTFFLEIDGSQVPGFWVMTLYDN